MPKIATVIPFLVPDEKEPKQKSGLRFRGVPGGLPAPSGPVTTREDTAPNMQPSNREWKRGAQWARFFHSGRPAGDSWTQPKGGRLATDMCQGGPSNPGKPEPQGDA